MTKDSVETDEAVAQYRGRRNPIRDVTRGQTPFLGAVIYFVYWNIFRILLS